MTISLYGERSVTAAQSAHPLAGFFGWIARMRIERARRVALSALLELDHARLTDLGISRQDVVAAIRQGGRPASQALNSVRAANARL